MTEGMWDQRDTKEIVVGVHQSETYAVNRDRTFAGHLPKQTDRRLKIEIRPLPFVATTLECALAIDMPSNIMPAKSISNFQYRSQLA